MQEPDKATAEDVLHLASEARNIPEVFANYESEIESLYHFTDEDVDDRLAFDRYLAAAMQAILMLDTDQDMTPYDVVTEASAMAIEGVYQRRTILETHREALIAKRKPTHVLIVEAVEGEDENTEEEGGVA